MINACMCACMYLSVVYVHMCSYTCLVSMWYQGQRILLDPLELVLLAISEFYLLMQLLGGELITYQKLLNSKPSLQHQGHHNLLNLIEYQGTYERKDVYPTQTQMTVLYTLNSHTVVLIYSTLNPLRPLQVFATMSRTACACAPRSPSHQ